MPKQPCQHCGLPTFVPASADPTLPVFCCTGCAFAHRLAAKPDAEGDLTPLQTGAWLTGFALFNQGVFWLLQVLLRGEDRAALSVASGYASIALGAAIWGLLVWALSVDGRRTAADVVVLALTAAGILLGLATRSPACAAGATIGLTLWTLRGFLRRRRV
ncbi:MAG: hypothetical protein ABII82_19605 [Verrucomicrobiota bacterium]